MSNKVLTILLLAYAFMPKAYGNDQTGQILITEIMASNPDCFLSPATNFDSWIELYNPSNEDYSLSGFYISDDFNDRRRWKCPDSMPSIPAKGYLIIWFDSNDINANEPNFKLDVKGGDILVCNPNGELIASETYPATWLRTSYARIGDSEEWGITCNPTPGIKNGESGFFSSQLDIPIVDKVSQIFSDKLHIHVTIPPNTQLVYTTDRTIPSLTNGHLSDNGEFDIEETTCYRFRLYGEGFIPSNIVSRSYIKTKTNFTLPILSVMTQDSHLYDDYLGIMVQGTNGVAGNGMSIPCNWNMNWSRPGHFSYLKEGVSEYEQDVNIEVAGGWSRTADIKSIKLKGDKKYGNRNLEYPFFDDKPYIRNRSLLLRNGGNDYACKITDAALEMIIKRSGIDLDIQSYQPVIYFLNGEFKGLMNLREPNNKHFVYANYGYEDDEIDMYEIKGFYHQLCGNQDKFDKWYDLSFFAQNNYVYDEICNFVDIDEYINYLASNLYLSLHDGWPRSNCKAFCPYVGKFRFISFDLDLPFRQSPLERLLDEKYYTVNGVVPDSIPKNVKIFLGMLKNNIFRKNFVDKMCLMGGSVFNIKHAEPVVREIATAIEPMMVLSDMTPIPSAKMIIDSLKTQNKKIINILKEFEPLGLQNSTQIRAKISSNVYEAHLFVNQQQIPYNDFDGVLFGPVTLKAISPKDHNFDGWYDMVSGELLSKIEEIVITNDVNIKALFTPKSDNNKNVISINEICSSNNAYINDYFKKSGWIELYNSSDEDFDIEGFYLSNDESNLHMCKISKGESKAGTIIPAHGFLVIWCDKKESHNQLHSNFYLEPRGEVFLTCADDSYTNSIIYSEMISNSSVGRFPDGCEGVFSMFSPTIGKQNIFSSYMKEVLQTTTEVRQMNSIGDKSEIELAYNNNFLHVNNSSDLYKLFVYSVFGKIVLSTTLESEYVDIHNLSSGVYIVCLLDKHHSVKYIKIVKQ